MDRQPPSPLAAARIALPASPASSGSLSSTSPGLAFQRRPTISPASSTASLRPRSRRSTSASLLSQIQTGVTPDEAPPLSPRARRLRDWEAAEAARERDPDDTFYRNVLVRLDEPIGSMSMSPYNRDVVLAARKGLFILDLSSPYDAPRFLPQGGNWEVADIQWNPHPSHAPLIASTSNTKLLIWNLEAASGRGSIEHVLHAHQRAITDINWHPFAGTRVASCGMDGWVWEWDLRIGGSRPVMGLCDWSAGATQVKWNRKDGHLLASSHGSVVHVWDDRKGSHPLTTIQAHASRTYGLDWSRRSRSQLITSSLDRSIKLFDLSVPLPPTSTTPSASLLSASRLPEFAPRVDTPQWALRLQQPALRARHLPFGEGVMSIAQRGENSVQMWGVRDGKAEEAPAWSFRGHEGQIKEFVWRTRGGQDLDFDDREFQLITWSKDRTLRLWPIDRELTKLVGHEPGGKIDVLFTRRSTDSVSYRKPTTPPPTATRPSATVTAPTRPGGGSSSFFRVPGAPSTSPPRPSSAHSRSESIVHSRSRGPRAVPPPRLPGVAQLKTVSQRETGGSFMTRGPAAGKAMRQGYDQVDWLKHVAIERDDPGQPGSGNTSAGESAPGRSRMPSLARGAIGDRDATAWARRSTSTGPRRSSSMERSGTFGDSDPQDLGQELMAVTQRYAKHPRIRFEKIDVGSRTCTVACTTVIDGQSILLRATFTFPSGYPQSDDDSANPTVELERNAALTLATRASILRQLRTLRQTRRPCLDACVRFLAGIEDAQERFGVGVWEDDSDEEDGSVRGGRLGTSTILAGNVPTPRTCGATFGPDGQLVCFFPPALVGRKPLHSRSPSTSTNRSRVVRKQLYSSIGVLSKAIAGLSRLANAGDGQGPIRKVEPMLYMEPVLGRRRLRSPTRDSQTSGGGDRSSIDRGASAFLLNRTVHIHPLPTPSSRALASEFRVQGAPPAELCVHNARVACRHGRPDLERIWASLAVILASSVPVAIMVDAHGRKAATRAVEDEEGSAVLKRAEWGFHPMGRALVDSFFAHLRNLRDAQMLALLSCVLADPHVPKDRAALPSTAVIKPVSSVASATDYFSLRPRSGPPLPVITPSGAWHSPAPYFPNSPTGAPSLSSGKGSWSAFFNNSSFGGLRSAGTPPSGARASFDSIPPLPTSATLPDFSLRSESIPVPRRTATGLDPSPRTGRGKRVRHDSTLASHANSPPLTTHPLKSESGGSRQGGGGGSSLGPSSPRQSRLQSVTTTPKPISRGRVVKTESRFEDPDSEKSPAVVSLLDPALSAQFDIHRLSYASMLYRWQLLNQRAEILKSVAASHQPREEGQPIWVRLDADEGRDGAQLEIRAAIGDDDKGRRPDASHVLCIVCHLPIKGLTQGCLICQHASHSSCFSAYFASAGLDGECPTGCGCQCLANAGAAGVLQLTEAEVSPSSSVADENDDAGDGDMRGEGTGVSGFWGMSGWGFNPSGIGFGAGVGAGDDANELWRSRLSRAGGG